MLQREISKQAPIVGCALRHSALDILSGLFVYGWPAGRIFYMSEADRNQHRPRLAFTLGDVAGVGPESIVGAWAEPSLHDVCRGVVVGHPGIVRRAVDLLHSVGRLAETPEVVEVDSAGEVDSSPGVIPCLAASSDEVLEVGQGKVDACSGRAAHECVVLAAELALAGQVDGLVTAPLSKAALHMAGLPYPGHTELLAELCGVDDFAMMLYLPPGDVVCGGAGLGVVHVTLHTALRDVFGQLTSEAITSKCGLADDVMRRLGADSPRVGVCALNPHAGEGGLFGDEEQTVIAPAVEHGRRLGMNLTGPLPADALMVAAREGKFDAVVAMYHDQGHIALKLLGMHRAVNVTLGLPIVRTSVAHGTAADLAWKGRAECEGMLASARVAAELVAQRGASSIMGTRAGLHPEVERSR